MSRDSIMKTKTSFLTLAAFELNHCCDMMDIAILKPVHLKIVRANSINMHYHKVRVLRKYENSLTRIFIWMFTFVVKLLGCWKDAYGERAIAGDHGKIGIYGCYIKAKSLGNRVFSIYEGEGKCFTSSTAGDTYRKYGPCNGPNNAYEIDKGNSLYS